MNLYFPRYSYPTLLFISIIVAALAVVPLRAVAARYLRLPYVLPLSTVVLLFAAVYSYGVPSVAKVRKDIDQQWGGATKEILSVHANVIAGSYFRVWPAVYHANLVLYEQGQRKRIFGLTIRDGPTRKSWSQIPLNQVRAAVLTGDDDDGKLWLTNAYGAPMTMVDRLSTIDVFAHESPSGSPPSSTVPR